MGCLNQPWGGGTDVANHTDRGAQANAELTFTADHPMGADQFEQTAQAWNRRPTPFLWNGKRRQRRRKRAGDGHAIGGSGAHTRHPMSSHRRRRQEWHTPRQVTH